MQPVNTEECLVEWQPEERDAWVVDAEKWITQIKGVLQCKIDLTPDGEVSGVHVVARSDREPRHIVRDVEGLLKARLGVSVFYKKIGVVQVMESDPAPDAEPEFVATPEPMASREPVAKSPVSASAPDPQPEPEQVTAELEAVHDAVILAEEFGPRLKLNGVGVMSNNDHLRAEVDLQAAGLEASGVAEGANRYGGDIHLVALATLEAVQALVNEPLGLELVELRRERLGRDDIMLVAVEMVQGRRSERLYGTCQPGVNLYQAVVYSVLDALNRRLEMMLFKSAQEAEY